ncbi:hypothetical protein SISSUDRAFT_1047986 [Sistotremastrum suecicum HHB10207 ss-3]|uniref:Hydrophobin n=1 Tax=Sistotremastrum suecicum HHB10207 ss-3 TaxID=1314776 RepID=A0A166CT01_9AGAM|nr:hypothetical protein SISSUDRAFT_1047986 [Sistotremastrum suecicum HHB10207 ss-3]
MLSIKHIALVLLACVAVANTAPVCCSNEQLAIPKRALLCQVFNIVDEEDLACYVHPKKPVSFLPPVPPIFSVLRNLPKPSVQLPSTPPYVILYIFSLGLSLIRRMSLTVSCSSCSV